MRLKVAFIGAGWVCQARYLPVFSQNRFVQCFGLVDTNPDVAEKVAKRYCIPYFSIESKPDSIEWLRQCDAVCVTSPPQNHYEWIMWALDNNKHVLTEKPVTVGREKGRTIFQKAKNSKVIFCVNHNTLFTYAAQKAQHLLATGRLGPITDYSINLFNSPRRHLPKWYDELPLGLLYDELSHFLYQADSVCPELRLHKAYFFPSRTGLRTPSSARISLLSKYCPVFFSLNFESPICEWHIIISCPQGIMIIDIFRDIFIFLPNDKCHQAFDQLRTVSCGIVDYVFGFIRSGFNYIRGRLYFGADYVFRHFIDTCLGIAPLPQSINLSSAERIFELLCDCIEELERNKQTIS